MDYRIDNLIYSVRGVQVMLDSDLAALFEVETKVFNQAVKRNSNRFPANFRFQLTKEEFETLRSQFVTLGNTDISSQNVALNKDLHNPENDSDDSVILRSQIVTSSDHGGRRYLPYVFTEQGVAMLTGLLRSDVAIEMSIRIMTAFVEMRKFISENALILKRINTIEKRQLTYEKISDEKFEQLFDALQGEKVGIKQNIFFDGQVYDAYSFVIQLIEKAEHEIVLIDNFIDNSVLSMLSKKKTEVRVIVVTHPQTKITSTDIQKFNEQYGSLSIAHSVLWHDRFILTDKKQLYHIGASLKDLGKKIFAFSLIEDKNLLDSLKEKYAKEL